MMLLVDWEATTGFREKAKARASRLFSRVSGSVEEDRVSEHFTTAMDASSKAHSATT